MRQRLAARRRPAQVRAHRLARDPRDAVSARDVGRHAPAHCRRHRHFLRAAPADRRRADHQPRPHHPGAVPQPAARPAARAWAGADLHHPQSRHRRQDVRPARRDVRRTDRRAGTGVAGLLRARPSLHQGAARLDPAHDRRSRAAHRDRRPAARSRLPAAGLRLRAALSRGGRPLPARGAAGIRRRRRPQRALLARRRQPSTRQSRRSRRSVA